MYKIDKDVPNCVISNSIYASGIKINNCLLPYAHINHTFFFENKSDKLFISEKTKEASFFLSTKYDEEFYKWDGNKINGKVANSLEEILGISIYRKNYVDVEDYIESICEKATNEACAAEFDRFYIPDRTEYRKEYGARRTFTFHKYNNSDGSIMLSDQERNSSKIDKCIFYEGVDKMIKDYESLSSYYVQDISRVDVDNEVLIRNVLDSIERIKRCFNSDSDADGKNAIKNSIELISEIGPEDSSFKVPGIWQFFMERRLFVRLFQDAKQRFGLGNAIDNSVRYFEELERLWRMHGMLHYVDNIVENGRHLGVDTLINSLRKELDAEEHWEALEYALQRSS